MLGESICRVRPDLPAVAREFDYLVPDPLHAEIQVGTIVRVPLQGRSVRGWVTAIDVATIADPQRLLPVGKVVGAGPPADVISLCEWAAWRWAGTPVAFMRAASPPNAVRAPWPSSGNTFDLGSSRREVLAWPPAADRRELVADRIATTGSTIVIVPDDSRVGSLVKYLERAGHTALLMHSGESAAQRTRAWSDARTGRCVVIGGRTAIWVPVPDLASVIVLDEGDEGLQEERSPTWNARDVAAMRASRSGASLTLVGVVPSLEAIAIAGDPVRPPAIQERNGWPQLEVVDLREEPPGTALLSERLARALHRAVDAGGRAICIVNRKGRARQLTCFSCDSLAVCERCNSAVVEGERGTERGLVSARLSCPQCGTVRPMICLGCHGTRMRARRVGISRLRDDLALLLPRSEVVAVEAATDDVPDVPVLMGTEAVLHRLPPGRPLLLAAFLDLDQELAAHRYRAAPQAVALLARAARLLGPRNGNGRLLIQTRLPQHEVIDVALTGDPTRLLENETERRREVSYPPFGALAEVSGSSAAVMALLANLPSEISVLGPTETATGQRALLHAMSDMELADALVLGSPVGRAEGRLRIAVDPPRV